ncbi:hypothetical protein [Altericroceibacterium indicum]|nr:hypothetical protein [Altericroceibacterium indicum]
MPEPALYNLPWSWHPATKLDAQVSTAPQYLRWQPHGLIDLFA